MASLGFSIHSRNGGLACYVQLSTNLADCRHGKHFLEFTIAVMELEKALDQILTEASQALLPKLWEALLLTYLEDLLFER